MSGLEVLAKSWEDLADQLKAIVVSEVHRSGYVDNVLIAQGAVLTRCAKQLHALHLSETTETTETTETSDADRWSPVPAWDVVGNRVRDGRGRVWKRHLYGWVSDDHRGEVVRGTLGDLLRHVGGITPVAP